MKEYILVGIILAVIIGGIIKFKKKKVKDNDKPKSADTPLPTPPKPPTGSI